jgi:hypothetical protein
MALSTVAEGRSSAAIFAVALRLATLVWTLTFLSDPIAARIHLLADRCRVIGHGASTP